MAVPRFYKNFFFVAITAFLLGSQCATIQRKEKNPNELLRNANENMRGGRFEEAKEGFKELHAKYPNSDLVDDAIYKLGYIYTAQKKYSEAKDYFGLLLSDYPKSEWSFDARVWFDLLVAWANLDAELDKLKSQLGTPKTPAQATQPTGSEDASTKIKELQKEIERLRSENAKLKAIIESGD